MESTAIGLLVLLLDWALLVVLDLSLVADCTGVGDLWLWRAGIGMSCGSGVTCLVTGMGSSAGMSSSSAMSLSSRLLGG